MRNENKLNPLFYLIVCHCRSLFFSVGELIRAPLASLMTIAVIGIAVALPAGLLILLENFQDISQHWNAKPSISLYLKQNTTPATVKQLTADLKRVNTISQVSYISPAEGMDQFIKATQFGKALSSLPDNPLPPVLVITPNAQNSSPQALRKLFDYLKALPQVKLGTLDMQWIQRLIYIIEFGQRFTYALALLFAIGVLLIVGNTIRLNMQSHQQEITVLKLVGATHGFIRRPLLYRGALYGCFGGILAWGLVSLLLWWLSNPINELIGSYQNHYTLQGMPLTTGLSIILISTLLTLVGSWTVIRAFLIAPEE